VFQAVRIRSTFVVLPADLLLVACTASAT